MASRPDAGLQGALSSYVGGISDALSEGSLSPGGAWGQASAGVPVTARQVTKRSALVSR